MKITFIGGGNMTTALIGGLAGKTVPSQNIHVVDINADALQSLRQQFGVSTAMSIDSALASSDVAVLAIKPQQIRDVAVAARPFIHSQLVLSIAAGIRIADLTRWLGGYQAIVRAMPNTPALIGKGVAGLAASQAVTAQHRSLADSILNAAGQTLWVEREDLLDAVAAISGSGPAYVFYFIEAMEKAAAGLGLSPLDGMRLARLTFEGAAELACHSSEPVATLRERVTSKGGTTCAALTSMEQAGVKEAIVAALNAAAARSRELGDESGKIQ